MKRMSPAPSDVYRLKIPVRAFRKRGEFTAYADCATLGKHPARGLYRFGQRKLQQVGQSSASVDNHQRYRTAVGDDALGVHPVARKQIVDEFGVTVVGNVISIGSLEF